MKRLNFKVRQVVLSHAIVRAIRSHVEIHGGRFREEDLDQMSVKIEQIAAEALMFGADCWPMPDDEPPNDNVVELRPAANPALPQRRRLPLASVGLFLRVLLLRLRIGWRIKLFVLPTAFSLMREFASTYSFCQMVQKYSHGMLATSAKTLAGAFAA